MNRLSKLLTALSVISVMACDAGLTDAEYIARAKDYIAQEDRESAAIELRNALKQNTANAEARLLLGEIYLAAGDSAAAQKELESALALGTDAARVTPSLARSLYLQGQFAAVLEMDAESLVDTAGYWDFAVTQALAYLAQGNTGACEALVSAALEDNPAMLYAQEAKARLEAAQGDFESARDVVDGMLKQSEEYGPAWSILGQLEQAEGNPEAAAAAYARAVDLHPAPVDDLLRLVYLEVSLGNLDAAEGRIGQLGALVQNDLRVTYAEGLLLHNRGKYAEAREAMEKILALAAEYPPALLYAGASSMALQQYEIAEQHLEKFLAIAPGQPDASRMLAAIRLQQNKFEEAEMLLALALEERPEDIAALSMLARAQLSQGRTELGLDALREAAALDPESARARVALASALNLNRDQQAAIHELQAAIELEPALATANASLVRLYIQEGETEKALAAANEFISASDNSTTARNLLGATYMSLEEFDLAEETFRDVLGRDTGNISANNGMAALALKSADFERAREHYNAILAAHPGHLRTLLNLASVETSAQNRPGAIEALETAIEANPEALDPRLKLSMSYLLDGRPELIPDVLEGMQARYPDNVALLSLLADSALRTARYNESQQLFARLSKLAPGNGLFRYRLARSYLGLGETAAYRKTLLETLEIDHDQNAVRLEYAQSLFANRQDEFSQNQVDILRERDYESIALTLLEGQLAQRQGDLETATAAYRAVYEGARNNYNLIRLANATWESGDPAGAIQLLTDWLEEHPKDTLALLELGNRYATQGQDANAITAYESAMDAGEDIKSPLALNNLAWLLRESDPSRALAYAREAQELVPDSAPVSDTLALLLINSGSPDDLSQARRLNERAREQEPDNLAYQFRQAQILAKAGQKQEAVIVLERITGSGVDFPERAAAQALLASLRG